MSTLVIVLFFNLMSLCCETNRHFKRLFKWVMKSTFWNQFIRLFIEEYLVISMAALIKLHALDFSNLFEFCSSIFAIILMLVILVFPVFTWKFLYKHHRKEDITEEKFKEKYGSLTPDLQVHDKEALLFQVTFMLRRVSLTLLIVSLSRWNWAQIQLIIFLNSLMLIYQGWFRPYSLREYNNRELGNEILIQINSYFLFIYVDFMPDPETR